jgi:hypothetical protein
MTRYHERLLDAETDTGWSHVTIQPANSLKLSGHDHWSVKTRTLRGGVSEGVQVVDICNGPLSLSVLPTRGMGIWQGVYRDLPLGWRSPVSRPVHPAFVNPLERNGLGWLNGFNELLCRCGLAYHGPPGDDAGERITLHGRIANLPAHRVEIAVDADGPGTLELRGIIDETTMFGGCYRLDSTLRMEAGSNRAHIIDTVTNLGARPVPLSLLYHINLGQPFLAAGSTVTVPSRDVAPRDTHAAASAHSWAQYAGPVAGFAEEAFFFSPLADSDGWCTSLLTNPAAHCAFGVRFRTDSLPWFTLWKNTQALEEGYVTGLEPGTGFPNFRAQERREGRLPMLGPGETSRFELELVVAADADSVASLQATASACQGAVPQIVHQSPRQDWS